MPEQKEVKCFFPDCKAKGKAGFKMKIKNPDKPEIEEFVQLPFCIYHWYIVSGDDFEVRKTRNADLQDGWEWDIEGPIEMVEMAERVMAAREMTRKSKN